VELMGDAKEPVLELSEDMIAEPRLRRASLGRLELVKRRRKKALAAENRRHWMLRLRKVF